MGFFVPNMKLWNLRSGPDHAPMFTISAQLENGATQDATAGSKRQAEQNAAMQLLAKLETT